MDSSADAPVGLPVTDTGVTAADRRSHPRFSAKVQLELRREGEDVPMRTETADLSQGGCYVQLSLTLALGTYVQGKLWIEDRPVKFRGRVVTSHPQFGNGIMFLQFEDNGEQILANFLDAQAV
ncbi:MAG: PilZ domain-containing protein [Terriglobales bacterium]